jgi:hypothetical protein
MKNSKLFQKQIRQKIQDASDLERVRFGFDICKRLLSEYKVISEQVYLPDIGVLDNSISYIDKFLEFNLLDDDKNLLLINKVEIIMPATDNLSQSEASCVSNTITSILELLLYLGDNDIDRIFAISDLMIDTIEFKILDRDDQISYEDVDNHPVLSNETKHQLEFFNK